jgi:hypothetical protein
MKRTSVMIGVACIVLTSVTPASTASQELWAYCFAQAEQVRPALKQPEKEAFIASCIADHTPTPPARRKY